MGIVSIAAESPISITLKFTETFQDVEEKECSFYWLKYKKLCFIFPVFFKKLVKWEVK